MKIRFYTTNKEAIVFDLEDILKQLNIEEQVATVGLVIEKDEAEVEAIAQTIQDDYPNMYLQAKEYGRNLTLACAELPNPTNPDIVTYLYAGDDATETDRGRESSAAFGSSINRWRIYCEESLQKLQPHQRIGRRLSEIS